MKHLYSKFSQDMSAFFKHKQQVICNELSNIDGNQFKCDKWERKDGGGGLTNILESEHIFEKAGVNTSTVYGEIPMESTDMFSMMLKKQGIKMILSKKARFFATGLSIVVHPQNPFIPTVHANYRYFELNNNDMQVWWFGGGTDLTPYYVDINAFKHFHSILKIGCDQFNSRYYPEFKEQCDKYFYLPHRKEYRGIGGIFFDYLRDQPQEILFKFVETCTKNFNDAYLPIVKQNISKTYNKSQKQWQLMRRGRYVEFNLLYDRGTMFGLKTNGRVESIFMSLPKRCEWHYNQSPEQNSPEYQLISILQNPQSWA